MKAIEKGHRAENILQDPLIVEALTGIEQALREQWTNASTTEVREELWYTLKGLLRFKHYLTVIVDNGVYEEALLEKEKLNG